MNTIKVKKGKTKFIAHRGLSGLERENTIRAFVAANNRTYYGCECDIHYTKDKHLVICHDEFTGRVSNTNLIISNSTFEEIDKVRLNEFNCNESARDLLIPTFTEYLELQKKYNKHCIIEIKCEISIEDAKEIMEIIKPYYDLVTFISFYLDNLKIMRKLDDKIPMMYLSSKYDDSLIDTCKEHNLGIDILYKELTQERINKFHDSNIIVNAWTINDKNVAKSMIEWGIDFITTNILE